MNHRQPHLFDTEELNYTRASLPSRSSSGNFSSSQQYPRLTSTCGHCGNTYPHPQGQDSCRARGCQCRSCVKINHFSRCCRSKPQNHSVDQHRSPRQQQRNELYPPPPTSEPDRRLPHRSFSRQSAQRQIRHLSANQNEDRSQDPLNPSSSDDEYLFTDLSGPPAASTNATISQVRDVTTAKAKVMIAYSIFSAG